MTEKMKTINRNPKDAPPVEEQPRTPGFSDTKNLCEYVEIFPTSSFALM
jgi:hypothetical protein